MRFFAYAHLPAGVQGISAAIANVAEGMELSLPDSAEKSAGLRKLLEAKDCFVRAGLGEPVELEIPPIEIKLPSAELAARLDALADTVAADHEAVAQVVGAYHEAVAQLVGAAAIAVPPAAPAELAPAQSIAP
jgi:hypothetical protein